MLNSYYNEQRLEINATSGILTKTYRDSFMVNFQYNSNMAKKLFSKEPTLAKRSREETVVIIQTMILSNNWLLCEVMWKEDFDKLFSTEDKQ